MVRIGLVSEASRLWFYVVPQGNISLGIDSPPLVGDRLLTDIGEIGNEFS